MYLKAEVLFRVFGFVDIEHEKLNISTLYVHFIEGKYNVHNGTSVLDSSNNSYIKIPRSIRYHNSEHKIYSWLFKFDDFYPYDTDENQIIIDYGNELLKRYPNHKKTINILGKMKIQYPELFI